MNRSFKAHWKRIAEWEKMMEASLKQSIPEVKPTPKQVRLARQLAGGLLQIGSINGVCWRIQFKTGQYPDERSGGGLSETALANELAKLLAKYETK